MLHRLLRNILYQWELRSTRTTLIVHFHAEMRNESFLGLCYETFPQFSNCCKFISNSSLQLVCHVIKSDISQDISKPVSTLCTYCLIKCFSSVFLLSKAMYRLVSSFYYTKKNAQTQKYFRFINGKFKMLIFCRLLSAIMYS